MDWSRLRRSSSLPDISEFRHNIEQSKDEDGGGKRSRKISDVSENIDLIKPINSGLLGWALEGGGDC